MEEQTTTLFQVPIELELTKSEQGDRRMVRGYASMEKIDQQGEIILQNGIDFTPLLKSGFLNYDHQTLSSVPGVRMPTIVGYPTRAEIRDKGLWVEGELLKSNEGTPQSEQIKLANELWELGIALQKSGGRRALAYSVEGGVVERHGNKIVKSVVRNLAITHKPVLAEATIELFAKSFYTGGEEIDITKALDTVIAGPTLKQNLDRGMTSLLYGDKQCDCYGPDGKFKGGISGAAEHLQKCCGLNKDQSIAFLRKLINNAPARPDLAALVTQAGLIGK